MAWQPVKGEIKEQTPIWDFEMNPELEGILVKKLENIGPNKSKMYHFNTLDEKQDVYAV